MLLALVPWIGAAALLVSERLARQRRDSRRSLWHSDLTAAFLAMIPAIGIAFLSIGHFDPTSLRVMGGGDQILDMDIDRIVKTLTGYWLGHTRTQVHPLQCLLFQPLGYIIQLAGIGRLQAAQAVCAGMIILSAGLLSATLWRITRHWPAAAVGAGAYIISFSFMMHAALPESAGLAAPTIIFPYYLYALYRGRPPSRRENILFLIAGGLALSVTTTNILHALIAYFARRRAMPRPFLRVTAYGLQIAVIVGSLSIVQFSLYRGSNLWFLPESIRTEQYYIVPTKDISASHIADSAAQMFAYSIVGPPMSTTNGLVKKGILSPYLSAEDLQFHTFPALTRILLVGTSVLIILILVRLRRTDIGKAILILLALNFILHILYGRDYLLYSGNWVAVLCLGVGIAVGVCKPGKWIVLGALALVLLNNVTAIRKLANLITEQASVAGAHFPAGMPGKRASDRVFVGSSGSYSPGIKTCGIHFAIWDPASKSSNLTSLTTTEATRRLHEGWMPIPVICSSAGGFSIEESVFVSQGDAVLVHLHLSSMPGNPATHLLLYAMVGNKGPAGEYAEHYRDWHFRKQALCDGSKPVLWCERPPDATSLATERYIFSAPLTGSMIAPKPIHPVFARIQHWLLCRIGRRTGPLSPPGTSSAALCWRIALPPGNEKDVWFASPIQSGKANFSSLGVRAEAQAVCDFWKDRLSGMRIETPDVRWNNAFRAIAAQAAMNIQSDGKPIISPVNYEVVTPDSAFIMRVLEMSGQYDLIRTANRYMPNNLPSPLPGPDSWKSINQRFRIPQFRDWKTLDEGKESEPGYWQKMETNPSWDPETASPHGTSLAKLFALMRTSLAYESNGACYLLYGAPPTWFKPGNLIHCRLPMEYGLLEFKLAVTEMGGTLIVYPGYNPPEGLVIHLPEGFGQTHVHIAPTLGKSPVCHILARRAGLD